MKKITSVILLLIIFSYPLISQVDWKFHLKIAPIIQSNFKSKGRILISLSKSNTKEPKDKSDAVIGFTAKNWNANNTLHINTKNKNVLIYGMEELKAKKGDKIYFQVTYKQNEDDGQDNVAGNLYSEVDSIIFGKPVDIRVNVKKIIPLSTIIEHQFVKSIEIESQVLSQYFHRSKMLKASILLPSTYYENPGKSFPICYRAGGLNGRWTSVNGQLTNKEFHQMWFDKNTPQVIYVYLDSQGPYGDTYQVDSENNGPCGQALTQELIPAVENLVNYKPETKQRFLAGCSTGGWIVLALQIFYPDFFDGAWSYSPDPVEFEHFGLINIYQDESVFYNRFGYLQPGRRTIYGEPIQSMKDWINEENTNSITNNYLVSGGQFGAYNAVFGPKANNGLPSLMFDPYSGKINKKIAQQWEKYDLKKYLEKNWAKVGAKIQGKLWIWTGDSDGLFSNVSTRFFQKFMESTVNPKSDAEFHYTSMAGHCQEYSDKEVLKMIGLRGER